MTPDTAALRALADEVGARWPWPPPYPNQASTDVQALVAALCDAADEVERLRDAERRNWPLIAHKMRRAEAERDASRTAHAALVADLRALCEPIQYEGHMVRQVLARTVCDLLDRHAPEETT